MYISENGKKASFAHIIAVQLLEKSEEYECMNHFYQFGVLSFCLPIGLDNTIVSFSSISAFLNYFFIETLHRSINFRQVLME